MSCISQLGFCLNVRGIFNFPGRLSDESAAAEFLIRLNRKIDEDFVGNDALFECLHSNIIAPDQYTVPIMRMHLSNYVELFKETLKVLIFLTRTLTIEFPTFIPEPYNMYVLIISAGGFVQKFVLS